MESNPVAVDGVLYTTNAPLGQVFAIDAATGNIIWTYTPSYAGETLNNGTAFTPGSGGRRPGVAVGEGLVFNGLPDGRIVALDQTTGKVVWETSIGSYKNNAKISSAPIYVNGMVIAADGSGDSGGNSPSIMAFRAANGARIWAWSPIPSPGQPGYSTWTNNGVGGNGSTLYGGGSFWESPLVDTARHELIVGTGNPEPWNSRGPGQNLYTCSIVALDLYTGQLKWYFQQVHHDMWDSDLPNNGVMFDGKFKVNGKMVTRPAVAYVNKVGMTWVIDRVTGKPLLPWKETPVPQNTQPGVNTWKTQPVPQVANVLFNPIGKDNIPCTTPTAVTSLGTPFATATAPDGKPYKIGCAYTPYDTTQYTVMPFEMMDWPASSYSPQNHTMITCGVTGRATAMEQIPAASQVASTFGGLGANRLGVADGSTPISNSGNFTRLRRADRQADVPSALVGGLLLRLGEHRRRSDLRRPLRDRRRLEGRRVPRGGRHEDRRVPLDVADDAVPGLLCSDHLHGERQAVRDRRGRRLGPQRRHPPVRSPRPAARPGRLHLHVRPSVVGWIAVAAAASSGCRHGTLHGAALSVAAIAAGKVDLGGRVRRQQDSRRGLAWSDVS